MTAGEPDPATVADVDRDLAALLRTLVSGGWEQQTAILNGAEHSGTLRALTEALLGAASQSLIRHMLAEAALADVEPGSPVWVALRWDLNDLLAQPGVREGLDQSFAEMQASIVDGGRGLAG